MNDVILELFNMSKGILGLAVAILAVVSMWKIYEKAGYEGWKSIIPFYSQYIMAEFTMGSGWYFLIMFIPIVGSIFALIMTWRLGTVFNKGIGFCLGLIFVPYVFLPILAFDSSEYYG